MKNNGRKEIKVYLETAGARGGGGELEPQEPEEEVLKTAEVKAASPTRTSLR